MFFLKKYKFLILFTLIFCLLPFVIYYFERATGMLPSMEEYYEPGGLGFGANHGPWRNGDGPEMFLMHLPLFSMAIVTIVFFFREVVNLFDHGNHENGKYRITEIGYLLLLLFIQFCFWLLQLIHLGWTVD